MCCAMIGKETVFFRNCLLAHLLNHPSARPGDIIKFCYQSAFGAEHLLTDEAAARTWFYREYASTPARDVPLWEDLSEDLCRVDLGAWKHLSLPSEYLYRIFVACAHPRAEGHILFSTYMDVAGEVVCEGKAPFSPEEWKESRQQYEHQGIHAIHHSDCYREKELPSYRVVEKNYLLLLPILQKIVSMSQKAPLVLAIDGRAAAGKTTLAQHLCAVTGASLISMDHFFLPPSLRTEERLAAPGGNIHHERFVKEVLPHLSRKDPFAYRVFDCSVMDYHGEMTVEPSGIRIAEGSYSLHPSFGNYADLTVFCDVSTAEQGRRILQRNGPEMANRFAREWIPMEEQYFTAYHIRNKANLHFSWE